MSYLPLPTPETLTAEQKPIYDALAGGPRGGVRGLFLALLIKPELCDKHQALGELLRYRTGFPPRLSELAILVTARQWDYQYEWAMHAPIALKAGLARETIDAIANNLRPQNMAADEQDIYEFSLELHRDRNVGEAMHRKIQARFGVVGAVELVALLGYYTMTAMTLNGHAIPAPPGATMLLPPREG